MEKYKKIQDPFYQREKAKYKRPIPSREFILSLLKTKPYPCSFPYLMKELKLDYIQDCDSLSYRLRAMMRDSQLLESHGYYHPIGYVKPQVKGYIHLDHISENAYLVYKDQEYVLSSACRKRLFEGDHVVAEILGLYNHKKPPLWITVSIIKRAIDKFWGYYRTCEGGAFVEPVNRIACGLLILLPASISPEEDDLMEVEVVLYPTQMHPCIVKFIKYIDCTGDYQAQASTFLQLLSHRYSLRLLPHPEEHYKFDVPDLTHRQDLTAKHFITIDDASTQDVDDAVYTESMKCGMKKLYVAIADVAHYVIPNTKIDREAKKRICSLYFPQTTVHMLPKVLSTNLCSLIPHKVRLTLVCEMQVDRRGKITSSKIYEAYIKVHAAITYQKIDALLKQESQLKNIEIKTQIDALYRLFKKMHGELEKSGKLDLARTSSSVHFDNHIPHSIIHKEPLVSSSMIETFMVSANQQVALYMEKHNLPCMYRVHLPPSVEKVDKLRKSLQLLKIAHPRIQSSSKSYASFLKKHRDHPKKELIHSILIQNLPPAHYSHLNVGHFGLGLGHYSHFTSPIRRYADLVNHRILKRHLTGKRQTHSERMEYLSSACSRRTCYANWAMADMENFCKYTLLKIKGIKKVQGRLVERKNYRLYFEIQEFGIRGSIREDKVSNKYPELNIGDDIPLKVEAVFPFRAIIKLGIF